METGLVEVGALVSFRSTVHGTTKIFAPWGGGPTAPRVKSYPRKVIRPKRQPRDGRISHTR